MQSRITKLAAAAVVVLAILLLARHLTGRETPARPEDKNIIAHARQNEVSPPQAAGVREQEGTPIAISRDWEPEQIIARDLFAKADVKGLLQLLDTGSDRTKVAVAGYLTQVGDESALPALERLAAQWTGPADENPFRQSIEQIQNRSSRRDKALPKGQSKEETPASPPLAANNHVVIAVHVSEKATGAPIPKAPIGTLVRDKSQKYTADDNGVFLFDLGESVPDGVTIAVRPEGYVHQVVLFRKPTRQSLPKTIQFSLEKGTVIGGVVQDSAGRPIQGATVESYIGELQFDQPHVNVHIEEKTDDQGRWRATCVPAQISRLWFSVYHVQFAQGGFEMPKDLKLDDLRAGQAVMVLQQGIAVAGRVTDTAGNPIAGANLLAGEDYLERDWTKTDAAGHFEFPHLRSYSKTFLLTVQTKGFAAQRRELSSGRGPAPVEFVLQPAQLLLGRVVDAAGYPIEDAFVAAGKYKGWRTIKWQGRTDAKGGFVWDYPPADAIQISISKQDCRQLLCDVVANGQEQVFVLAKPMTIQGTVTDGQTGRPVERFQVIPGFRGARGGFATWQRGVVWAQWQTAGRYSYTFSDDAQAYAVRIEADAYVPVESRFVDANEPPATIDLVLTKGPGLSGYVYDANARPVAGAEVFWHGLSILANGQAVNKQLLVCTTTDREGHFLFPPDNREDPLMVLCDQGIGVVPHDEFVKTGVITLTPWARVQGDLRIGRQKGVNRTLHLSRIARVQENVPMMSNETTTDADGRFVFERVYPGEFALYNQRYEVAPGQTLELHLGGAGRTVKGELILPGLGDTPIWAELYLAAPATPIPFEQLPKPSGYQEMSLGELEAWLERYGESQEGQAYIAWLQKMYPNMDGKGLRVEMDDRRAFHLDNVEPGVYALRGVVHRSPGFSGAQELEVLGRFWRQVVVPSITQESPLDVPLDLGAVTALPGDLKVGDPAPEFDVPTFGSERLRLLDYRGKVLLVGFYSRHYARSPAVEDLKNTYRQFHENPRFAQIGLLFSDLYLLLDRKAVEEGGLSWPHGLVDHDGKESTEYGVPTNSTRSVLIGPRGEVLAVGLSGAALMQVIEQALRIAP